MSIQRIIQTAERSALNETMRRDLGAPEMLESMRLLARHSKMRFDAYVEAGFTPDQALRLVAAPIITPEAK